jgi:hypothetical protein
MIPDVVEFDEEAGRHVNEEGQACPGRILDITVRSVIEKDGPFGSMARCRVCQRELSIENDGLFDPYPPPVTRPDRICA